jgi:hypothetical protein
MCPCVYHNSTPGGTRLSTPPAIDFQPRCGCQLPGRVVMGNCRGCCPEVGARLGAGGRSPAPSPSTWGMISHTRGRRRRRAGAVDGSMVAQPGRSPAPKSPQGDASATPAVSWWGHPRTNAAETRALRGFADDPEKPQAPPLRDMKRPRWGGQSRGCRGLYRGRVTTGRDPGQEVHRDVERRCWPPLF